MGVSVNLLDVPKNFFLKNWCNSHCGVCLIMNDIIFLICLMGI